MPRPKKEKVIPDEMDLVQRSYWVRKEDVVALEGLKGRVLMYTDLDNLDLSATVRGLIQYGTQVQSRGGREWEELVQAIHDVKNPKKRGVVPGSIR